MYYRNTHKSLQDIVQVAWLLLLLLSHRWLVIHWRKKKLKRMNIMECREVFAAAYSCHHRTAAVHIISFCPAINYWLLWVLSTHNTECNLIAELGAWLLHFFWVVQGSWQIIGAIWHKLVVVWRFADLTDEVKFFKFKFFCRIIKMQQ